MRSTPPRHLYIYFSMKKWISRMALHRAHTFAKAAELLLLNKRRLEHAKYRSAHT